MNEINITYKTPNYELTYNHVIRGCPKKHFHETLTMVALEKGELEVSVKKEFLLSVNRLLCINPYEIHSVPSIPMKNEKLYVLYIEKDWLESLQKELLGVESYLPLETFIVSQALYEAFINLCKLMLSDTFTMQKEEQLLLFLQTLLRQQTKQEQPLHSETLAHDIRVFIDEDKLFELTLEEVAIECRFSDQSHLYKYFKEVFGISPKAYQASLI